MKEILEKYHIKNALLVQPNFPIPHKSRNHKQHIPIGLLKISSFLKSKDIETKLIYFEKEDEEDFSPDIIFITSVFTYWSKYVIDCSLFYKEKYPNVPIVIGGVYASLMPEHCQKESKCNYIIKGPICEVEKFLPDYDLIDIDFQIIHTTRGCPRRCKFCGAYDIEPEWSSKYSIKNEVSKKKIIFYDNNLLANDYIEFILDELIELRREKKINYVESQSGVDGRILRKKPFLAFKMFKAGFQNVKIAWDGRYDTYEEVEKQIAILNQAGFKNNTLSIFMIYNTEIPYEEIERKRMKCAEWGVQIIGCRYIPLNQTFDNYNPYKKDQTSEDYYISEGWNDMKNKQVKRNFRKHNVAVRFRLPFYSKILMNQKNGFKISKEEGRETIEDFWDPLEFHNFDEGY